MKRVLRILKIITIILTCIFVALVILALLHSVKEKPNQNNTKKLKNAIVGEKILFADIGRLRAKTKDGVSLVIAPYFEYSKSDLAFQEELVKKKDVFRKIIVSFFSERSVSEIKDLGEAKIKTSLLVLINENLELSKIETLYFESFILLD